MNFGAYETSPLEEMTAIADIRANASAAAAGRS